MFPALFVFVFLGLPISFSLLATAFLFGLPIYGGVRLKTTAYLEKTRIPITIDVGFGDALGNPDYTPDWKSKIVIANSGNGGYNYFKLVVQSPDGQRHEQRLALQHYLHIVAATNYKQRVRKAVEYFHADRLNYAVVGTPNRLEYDQGFFVKNGDGAADIKPIAHLYKSQVYALANHLGLPEAVCNAVPSTDTYSLRQGQDEFYFALGYRDMDLALWCFNHQQPAGRLAQALGISERDAEAVYRDIVHKRNATAYLHCPPLLVEAVEGPVRLPDRQG